MDKSALKKKKKKSIIIIIVVILICIIIGGGYYFTENYQIPDYKANFIQDEIDKGNYSKAIDLANKYYKNDTYKRDTRIEEINAMQVFGVKSMSEVKKKQEEKEYNELKQVVDELKNLPIENVECVSRGNGFTDVNITIRNKGDNNVNYVKINLYYYDENNNVIQSEWTNDSSTILPNATQTITKMTNVQFSTVKAEIADIVH